MGKPNCEALVAIVERLVFAEENPTEHYENLAEEFYRDTMMIAPGKSVPEEMARDEEARGKAWNAWLKERRTKLLAEYRAALGLA